MSDSADQKPFFTDPMPFSGAEFVDNPEPRCPCVLLVDTSASMGGDPIRELNAGLVAFKDELMADSLAAKRIEVGVVGFGPVSILSDFSTPDSFHPPSLIANGDTPMGAAVVTALDMIARRKAEYKQAGVSYYRPWVFLITDGAPTDEWMQAASRVRDAEGKKQVQFYAVGVQGANLEVLSRISVRAPVSLKGLRFRELFSWLSRSLQGVSRSQVGDQVPLENPTGPQGWAVSG